MTAGLPRLGIGIDVGGTTTKAAVIDADGGVVAASSLPTRRGPEGVLFSARQAANDAAAAAGLPMGDAEAVGVGIPGAVDPQRGTVRHAVNVGIGRDGIELGRLLSDDLGVAVHVENDVRVAALGADWHLSRWHGATDDLAYLSIGTGIAAGYVRHGRMWRGSSLVAGEIGHIPIDPNGPRCACGQVGCIEAIASGSAIERLWPTEDGTSALQLQRAAAGGDPRAVPLWAGVVAGLSRAVLLLALTWDPQLVVIGGGVAALGEELRVAIAGRLSADGAQSEFLASLDLGARMRIIDPSVPIGPIGAVRAAYEARLAGVVPTP